MCYKYIKYRTDWILSSETIDNYRYYNIWNIYENKYTLILKSNFIWNIRKITYFVEYTNTQKIHTYNILEENHARREYGAMNLSFSDQLSNL